MGKTLQISPKFVAPILVGLFLITLSGVILDLWPLVFLPLGALFLMAMLYNLEWPYLLLLMSLPLSWELELGNGFATNMPSEPLMIISMGLAMLFLLKNMNRIDARLLLHPMSLLLLIMYAWCWITAFFSENVIISLKFCLAKTWYIFAFYVMSIIVLRQAHRIDRMIKVVLYPLVAVVLIILVRHSQEGFSFEAANFVMAPFFRNHVSSAAFMSIFLPFVIYLLATSRLFLQRAFYVLAILLLIGGIYFSYTRAAHISVIVSLFTYFIFRWKLMKWCVVFGLIASLFGLVSVVQDNKYLDYAPEFETTVSHSSFEDLVDATYQGKDISTMERVYRWVAGFHMIKDKPVLGFGPGSFYNNYQSYTVTNFRTYVSDNPERSGVHCYYLMTWIEQGLIGLLLFLSLLVYALLKTEAMFHRAGTFKEKALILAVGMSLVVITLFQLINDQIETDKVGSIFFINLALVFLMDMRQRKVEIISPV